MVRQLISVITPTLNEVGSVQSCHDAVARVFAEALSEYDYEHIFADNASSDGTQDQLRKMADASTSIKVILNSRNFGAEASMLNAVLRSSGDAVVVMIPADLQDPPELIAEFVALWNDGFKVVYGIRQKRYENLVMRAMRKGFYRAVNRISDFSIPQNVGEFQLIDRKVVEALRGFSDTRPYLRGMIAACGFESTGIKYDVRNRVSGRSTMNIPRLIDIGLNGLISFSSLPMRVSMMFGFFIAAFSLVYSLFSFFVSLIFYREFQSPGIATLIVALFFFGGVQLFFMGILGEYVLAIHGQVRRGPLVIEAEAINFDPGSPGKSKPGARRSRGSTDKS
jgi:glycosyltransferase involved in cell wall biosynthesis